MKKILAALLVTSLLTATPIAAMAAQCRDAKGHFIKCPPKAAPTAAKATKCRDAKGKFIKCK
jgi:hypothetical protein